jgi:hypothetical protein
VALSPQANYTDWATATCRRNLVSTSADRRVSRGQHGRSPTVVNLSFIERNYTAVYKCSNKKRAFLYICHYGVCWQFKYGWYEKYWIAHIIHMVRLVQRQRSEPVHMVIYTGFVSISYIIVLARTYIYSKVKNFKNFAVSVKHTCNSYVCRNRTGS